MWAKARSIFFHIGLTSSVTRTRIYLSTNSHITYLSLLTSPKKTRETNRYESVRYVISIHVLLLLLLLPSLYQYNKTHFTHTHTHTHTLNDWWPCFFMCPTPRPVYPYVREICSGRSIFWGSFWFVVWQSLLYQGWPRTYSILPGSAARLAADEARVIFFLCRRHILGQKEGSLEIDEEMVFWVQRRRSRVYH